MIHENHLNEWLAAGVSQEIAVLNIESLDDPRDIDQRLNRNNDRRWVHWSHGSGWWVAGVDPRTNQPTNLGGQFKPDRPVQRTKDGLPEFKADGSPAVNKYFSASGDATHPLFLDAAIPNYWCAVVPQGKTAFLTEGAKKAGCLLTLGEPAISLPGVENGQAGGTLKEELKLFSGLGWTNYLAFDSDYHDKVRVRMGLDRLGRLLTAEGSIVKIIVWDKKYKGIDDYLTAFAPEERAGVLAELKAKAISFEEWRKQVGITNTKNSDFSAAKDDIGRILSNSFGKGQQSIALAQYAQQSGIPLRTVEQLAAGIRQDYDLRAEGETQKAALKEILALGSVSLDLGRVLPKKLANLLTLQARALPAPIEYLFQPFLTITGGLIGRKAAVTIKEGWKQYPVFWTSIVGVPGSKKSPAAKVVTDPLVALRLAADRVYQDEKFEHERFMLRWQALSKNEKAEATNEELMLREPPKCREYYLNDATFEAAMQAHSDGHPKDRLGMSLLKDELAGLFSGMNQYKGGKGSDRQNLLSCWNSGEIKINRMTRSSYLPESHLCIFGGIQEAILPQYLSGEDPDGMGSRFLYAAPPTPTSRWSDLDGPAYLKDYLEDLYRTLDQEIPEGTLCSLVKVRPLVREFIKGWLDGEQAKPTTTPGLRGILGKLEGYGMRLALWLHLIHWAWERLETGEIKPIPEDISAETFQNAIYLIKYYYGQATILHARTLESSLPSYYLKIINYCLEKGGSITPSEISRKNWKNEYGKVIRASEAISILQDMTLKGFGVFEGGIFTHSPELAESKQKLEETLEIEIDEPDYWDVPRNRVTDPPPPSPVTPGWDDWDRPVANPEEIQTDLWATTSTPAVQSPSIPADPEAGLWDYTEEEDDDFGPDESHQNNINPLKPGQRCVCSVELLDLSHNYQQTLIESGVPNGEMGTIIQVEGNCALLRNENGEWWVAMDYLYLWEE